MKRVGAVIMFWLLCMCNIAYTQTTDSRMGIKKTRIKMESMGMKMVPSQTWRANPELGVKRVDKHILGPLKTFLRCEYAPNNPKLGKFYSLTLVRAGNFMFISLLYDI